MSRRNSTNNGTNGDENRGGWSWGTIGTIIAGGAAVAFAAKMFLGGNNCGAETKTAQSVGSSPRQQSETRIRSRTSCGSTSNITRPRGPVISSLSALLEDIYVKFIAINSEEFQHHYNVFMNIFNELHSRMKQVDEYYNRYSSNIQFAGSHYDRLRITKPNEFDMDIVIRVPVNTDSIDNGSDIEIQQKYPGYVELRAGTQYRKISIRDGVDCVVNRAAHSWLDEKNYISRNKFAAWFKSVVDKAMNTFTKTDGSPSATVNGERYKIRFSSSGPACTLIIEGNDFRLDVDLVPALKFPESRWPIGCNYRDIPAGCSRDYWLLVPKPNKGLGVDVEKRSWRIGLHVQEKAILHNTHNLRQVVRLLKKLRDTQKMDRIASYYIKTLFLWEASQRDALFWSRTNVADIFKHMLRIFHSALLNKNIPYFWNKRLNLIGQIKGGILEHYASKVGTFIQRLDTDWRCAESYLLTPHELVEYHGSFV